MKCTIHFLGQLILVLGLANIAILLVPRCIRKTIRKTFKITYKVCRFAIIQVTKLVKTEYGIKDNKKKAVKQPSNVINLQDKISSK